jgi:TMEM175 potassium channel family protein
VILARALMARQGTDSTLSRALGRDRKGKVSLVIYLAAIPFAFVNAWVSCALYVTVALIWLIPDRRIERAIAE